MSSKKIQLRDHVFHLRSQLVYIIIAGIYVFYMINSYGKYNLTEYFKPALFIIGVALIPTLIIHFNYYFINRNDRLEISGGLVIFSRRNKNYEIPIEQITKIQCFMTNNFAEKNTPWLPWEEYHFFVIQTGTDDYIITSLLYPKLHEVLSIAKEKIVVVKDWFPITSMYTPNRS
jgi:hypothetical protein